MKETIKLFYNTITSLSDEAIYEKKKQLSAIISDLVTEKGLKRLLLISIQEGVVKKLFYLYNLGLSFDAIEIEVLKKQFKEENFLEKNAANIVFDFWLEVIWWEDYYLLVPMRNNKKWGFCNENKEIKIPYQFDYAKPYSNGLSVVKIEDKYGYIDKRGNIVIPAIYEYAESFRDGVANVKTDKNLYAYIDTKGEYIINPYCLGSTSFDKKRDMLNDGLVRFYNPDIKKYGFLSVKNKNNIAPIYDNVYAFSNGFAIIQDKDYKTIGVIDKEANFYGLKFDYMEDFSNDRALVIVNGKAGFIDTSFNMVIPPSFDSAKSFSDGYAAICINGLWGYIDLDGKIIIYPKYLNAKNFSEERAFVLKESGWGFVDCLGNEYTSFDYFDDSSLGWNAEDYGYFSSDLYNFKDGLAIISKLVDSHFYLDRESKFGCVDIFGNEVIKCKYPPIDGHFENGLAKVGYEYDGGWSYNFYGYIDKSGNTYGFDMNEIEENESEFLESQERMRDDIMIQMMMLNDDSATS